ncbi:MAG: T9SS type A sorting domain-containing protein [Bacteroidota bacterium]
MAACKIEILSNPVKHELVFSCDCRCEEAVFSISDNTGHVQVKGKIDNGTPNKISLKDLTKGIYLLSVVDGDRMAQARFQKI